MKNKMLSLILFYLLCSNVFAQISFQKRYNVGNLYNFLTSVVQNPDKSYIMAGYGINLGQYELDVVKTDSTGSVLWAKRYYSPIILATDFYQMGRLIRTSDGGYIACGTRKTDAFVMKLDASGNVSWSKTYYISGASSHYLNNIKPTSDGGYIAVGYMQNSSNDSTDAFIVKITSNGSLSWGGRLNNPALNSNDAFLDVEEDPGSGYIAVGYISELSGTDTTLAALIVKFNTNGSIAWSNILGNSTNDEEASVIIKSGSNFYIGGNTTQGAIGNDFFFMEMTPNGTQNWAKRYNAGLADFLHKILPTSTGFSLIGGELTLGGNIVKVDFTSTGNYINNSGYYYSGGYAFPINVDAQKTTDNGWIMGAMSIDYNFYLLKANSSGSTGCYETPFNPSITTFTFTQNSFSGSYTTSVSSGNPSVTTGSFTIDQNQIVTDCQFVPCDTPVVSITPVNPTICSGQSVTLTASGSNGSGPVTSWSWNTGQTSASINVSPTNTTTYSVVGYVGSCPSQTQYVTVNVNPSPNVTISGNTTICQGQSTTLTASGGNSYTWSNGVNGSTNIVSPTTSTTYTVTATNTYNCTSTASTTVNVNPLPNASISGPTTICSGQNITLTASGGDTYMWNTNATSPSININPTTTTTYSVTVLNSNTGCSATANHTVNVNPNPIVSIAGDTIICEGYSTTLTASGGDIYQWSNGANSNSITISPPIGIQYYTVTVTNSSTGCYTVRTIRVEVVSSPDAQITGDNSICPGESTTLIASGGTSYQWNNGSTSNSINVSPSTTTTYYVTVYAGACSATTSITVVVNTPPTASISGPTNVCANNSAILTANGGDSYIWNTNETSQSITVSPNSNTTYYVTVTDNTTQCTAIASHTIIVQPNPTITFSGNTTICQGQSTTIAASGGDLYQWSNGSNSNTITVSPLIGQTTYNVTVTNSATGCSSTSSIVITVYPKPQAIVNNDTTICNGSSVQLNASGGNSYNWFPNNYLTSTTIPNPTATPSDTITYHVVVTDINGCKDTASVTINVVKINSINFQVTNTTCYEGNDGSITITNISGIPPFTYNWGFSTSNTVTNLTAGTYNVTITDGLGCTYVYQNTVNQPPAMTYGSNIQNVSCYQGSNGSIQITISGGTPPYVYFWSNGNQNNINNNLTAGNYSVTVTDANNCSLVINNLIVNQPDEPLSYSIDTIQHNVCYGSNDALLQIHATGGIAPYQYSWSNGSTTNLIYNVNPGIYTVTITDNNNCSAIESFIIQEATPIIIQETIYDASCIDGKDGRIELNISGSNPPFNVLWSNNDTSLTATNLHAGNYIVTITDQKNCQVIENYTVHADNVECLLIPDLITPNGDNVNDKFEIRGIEYFSEVEIEIFDRWGDKIFHFSGSGSQYANPLNQWDGTYKGKKECTLCSFIYIVNVHNNKEPYQGIVTIKK